MNPSATIDPQALEGLRELNPDDPAFLRELIDLFVADVADRLAELERALATADANLLTRAAHTIKGSCSNFGAVELTRISQTMELQGKAADLAAAAATLPALKAEYTAVSEALKQFR
jgi:HPt (histidine-containing phosphotransfer) domain-containing protein